MKSNKQKKLARKRKLAKRLDKENKISSVKKISDIRIKGKDTLNSFKKKYPSYNKYLKSIEWQQIRRIHFGKKKRICIACKSTKKIHVHHKSYKRLGTTKEVLDLITVCEKCHSSIHRYEKEFKVSVTKATRFILKEAKKNNIPKKKRSTRDKQIERGKKLLLQLKLKKEATDKDRMIRELRLSGINGNFTNLPYSTIQKIHSKYPIK